MSKAVVVGARTNPALITENATVEKLGPVDRRTGRAGNT